MNIIKTNEPLGVKAPVLFFGIVGISLIGAMLFTLKERLKEINEEDEDDISKY